MRSTRTRLTTEQIVEVGSYMWLNREQLQQSTRNKALEITASATKITISITLFIKLSEEMGLTYSKKRAASPRQRAVEQLRRKYKFKKKTTKKK